MDSADKQIKVDVLLLTYRGINPMAFPEIQAMLNYSVKSGIDVKVPPVRASALVHRARNHALTLVRDDADYVLLIDDDMCPGPNALLKLLQHNVPAVAAYMTTRQELPVKIAGFEYDPATDDFKQLLRLRPDSLCRAKPGSQLAAGTAFLLVKKSVFDAALQFHLEARDWLADNQASLDRMSVSKQKREDEREHRAKKRTALFEASGYHSIFHFATNTAEREMGEDLTFCRNLMRMGVQVYIDSSTVVAHIGYFPYSPANLDDTDPSLISARVLDDEQPPMIYVPGSDARQ